MLQPHLFVVTSHEVDVGAELLLECVGQAVGRGRCQLVGPSARTLHRAIMRPPPAAAPPPPPPRPPFDTLTPRLDAHLIQVRQGLLGHHESESAAH